MLANFLDLVGITSNFKKKRLSLLWCVDVFHKNMALGNFTSLMRRIRQSNIPKTGCTWTVILFLLFKAKPFFTSSLPSSLPFLKLPNYDMWCGSFLQFHLYTPFLESFTVM